MWLTPTMFVTQDMTQTKPFILNNFFLWHGKLRRDLLCTLNSMCLLSGITHRAMCHFGGSKKEAFKGYKASSGFLFFAYIGFYNSQKN